MCICDGINCHNNINEDIYIELCPVKSDSGKRYSEDMFFCSQKCKKDFLRHICYMCHHYSDDTVLIDSIMLCNNNHIQDSCATMYEDGKEIYTICQQGHISQISDSSSSEDIDIFKIQKKMPQARCNKLLESYKKINKKIRYI